MRANDTKCAITLKTALKTLHPLFPGPGPAPYQCGCQKSIAATQIAPNVITSQNQFLSSHDPEPLDPLIANLHFRL